MWFFEDVDKLFVGIGGLEGDVDGKYDEDDDDDKCLMCLCCFFLWSWFKNVICNV